MFTPTVAAAEEARGKMTRTLYLSLSLICILTNRFSANACVIRMILRMTISAEIILVFTMIYSYEDMFLNIQLIM